MGDSFFKKENNKKKIKKKQDKALKREDRKVNNNKGKSLEEMIIYVDVNGNFTSVPPHLQVQEENLPRTRAAIKKSESEENKEYTGIIKFMSDKGYGFITDDKSKENVFFHSNQLSQPVDKNDKVIYKTEDSLKGIRAVGIKKIE